METGFYPTTAMPDPDWWDALWPDPRQVLVDMKPGFEAGDLCCGHGLFTAPLALMAKQVFAIDIDPEMLALARRKLAAAAATNCELIEADVSDEAAVAHRRPREETTVLGQPRGPKTEMRMTPTEVAGAAEPVGLKLASVVELPPYHYGALFVKAPN